jgi:5-methyltetrahydrofolate--homocysteine methyltransferase
MAGKPLIDDIKNGKIFILDGALGTNMQLNGLPAGKLNEEWVLYKPEIPLKIHSDFAEAGSDILLTMTFCANPIHLSDTPFAQRTKEINYKAVDL